MRSMHCFDEQADDYKANLHVIVVNLQQLVILRVNLISTFYHKQFLRLIKHQFMTINI